MTHIGATYGRLGGAALAGKDYVEGSASHDYLRNGDMGWNRSKGLYVKWTDGLNQKHRVTLQDKDDTITIIFPVSGKKVDWFIGPERELDSTPFPGSCDWIQAKFTYAESSLFNKHGILVEIKGFGKIQTHEEIDWSSVRKFFNEGLNIREIFDRLFQT